MLLGWHTVSPQNRFSFVQWFIIECKISNTSILQCHHRYSTTIQYTAAERYPLVRLFQLIRFSSLVLSTVNKFRLTETNKLLRQLKTIRLFNVTKFFFFLRKGLLFLLFSPIKRLWRCLGSDDATSSLLVLSLGEPPPSTPELSHELRRKVQMSTQVYTVQSTI